MIKTLAISTLVHIFSALPNPPKSFIQELNTMLYTFLWNDKKDKIKRSTIIRTYNEGGIRMVDIESFIKALKLSNLRKYLQKNRDTRIRDIFLYWF